MNHILNLFGYEKLLKNEVYYKNQIRYVGDALHYRGYFTLKLSPHDKLISDLYHQACALLLERDLYELKLYFDGRKDIDITRVLTRNKKLRLTYKPAEGVDKNFIFYKIFNDYHKMVNRILHILLLYLENHLRLPRSSLIQYAYRQKASKEGVPHLDKDGNNLTTYRYEVGMDDITVDPHFDRCLLTFLATSKYEAVLEAQNRDGQWVNIEKEVIEQDDDIVIFGGAILHHLTAGYFPATMHRVANNKYVRYSTAFKLKPNFDVVLDCEKIVSDARSEKSKWALFDVNSPHLNHGIELKDKRISVHDLMEKLGDYRSRLA